MPKYYCIFYIMYIHISYMYAYIIYVFVLEVSQQITTRYLKNNNESFDTNKFFHNYYYKYKHKTL